MAAEDFRALSLHMPASPRPSLITQQSSSLPSTPYQHARKLSFTSRSPSPDKGAAAHSPRSVHSESDSTLGVRGSVPFLTGCKYETGMAYSRRRVPYSVGGDKLERAQAMPKKYLNPVEENRLSGDMRELYDRILPSSESENRRATFVRKLENILNAQWPGSSIKVHVFGSSGNMLCTSDSDVDICITTPKKHLERVCLLAQALAEHGMERVICVPHAKVPIVKIWDPELQLACDMNVNNTLALENTRMIRTYVEIDERVRPLAMIIKHWTKQRVLNDAALGGTLSSYTWICMILNFLQTRNPPVLPSLHGRPHQRLINSEGHLSAFADDMESLYGFGHKNKETLGELLFHFFRRYAHEIDYDKSVLSVREAQLISKDAKKWHLMQNNRLCVEEPFNTDRNLGNTADDISFRGLHLELRRAFELVSEATLAECCEAYIFPATEEKFWERPPPQPRPVLARSASQSGRGRGGGNYRGGRHIVSQHRPGQTNRRVPSSTPMNRSPGPLNGAQAVQAQNVQLQIHDELFHRYQYLQAQEQQLRMQLLHQAQAQLHAQAHAQAQAQLSNPVSPHSQQTAREHSAMMNRAPLSAPLRQHHGSFYYPFSYTPVEGSSQQSIRTNPSSPSMATVQPELRRGLHRSSDSNNPSGSSLRSHSQPARPVPSGVAIHGYIGALHRNNRLQQYQPTNQHQSYAAMEMTQNRVGAVGVPGFRAPPADSPFEDNLPKEYVGYYVHKSPASQSYRSNPVLAPVSGYSHDFTNRIRGHSQGPSRLRDGSQSPTRSPSISFRDRAFSVRSAASAPSGPLQAERQGTSISGQRSGPIIVDGSRGGGLPEFPMVPLSMNQSSAMSEAVVNSDDALDDFPGKGQDSPSTEIENTKGPGVPTYIPQNNSTPNLHRLVDVTQNGNTESAANSLRTSIRESASLQTATSGPGLGTPCINADGLGIICYDTTVAPTPTNADQTPSQETVRYSIPTPKLDIQPNKSNLRHDKSLMPIPLLSPVREVRTPSPTANRREDSIADSQITRLNGGSKQLYLSSSSTVINGKHKESDNLGQKTNGTLPKNTSTQTTSLQQQTNGWQSTSKKNKKTKSKANAVQNPSLLSGELLPSKEAERKGG